MDFPEQDEANDLAEKALEQGAPAVSAISDQLLDAIRSARSFDQIGEIEPDLSTIVDPLAVAIFNLHLLGRAQIWAEFAGEGVNSQQSQKTSMVNSQWSMVGKEGRLTINHLPSTRLAAVVLETEFEPLPFEEAIDYFRRKLNLSPAQFAQLSEAARAKAFTIGGGATRQARQSIKDLLSDALEQGLTLREFQAEAENVLDRVGLSERTPWYWETVYRTNLQTSYQVGRWKQMTDPDVLAERPYLRYVSARLPTSRASHVDKHGIVLPAEDSFWATWYPPNGFNCYCSATSVSESLLSRRGWDLSERRSFDDPDEGFQTNPARSEEI